MGVVAAEKAAEVQRREGGVYEEEGLPGLRQLDLVGPDGKKHGVLLICEEWVDRRLVKDLWKLLDRHAKTRSGPIRLLRKD